MGVFSRFLNFTNGTKSCKASDVGAKLFNSFLQCFRAILTSFKGYRKVTRKNKMVSHMSSYVYLNLTCVFSFCCNVTYFIFITFRCYTILSMTLNLGLQWKKKIRKKKKNGKTRVNQKEPSKAIINF